MLYQAPAFDVERAKRFTLARCEGCGLVRSEPVLSKEELGDYYSEPYYGAGQQKFTGLVEWLTQLDNQQRARKLLALLHTYKKDNPETVPRILDIGCGRANLLAALSRLGCECHGVERAEFPLDQPPPGVHLHRGELTKLSPETNRFDAVVLWHVLEHLNDPVITLKTVTRLMRPGGILALAVPNFGSWQAALFKSAWFHLDLPRHTYHFNRHTLKSLLHHAGLQPLKTSTWAFDQNSYGFIQSALNRLSPPNDLNKLYTLLKNSDSNHAKYKLIGWLLAGGLLTPLAILEYLLSGLLGKGATLIIYAQKPLNVTG